jgi:hypothetical protein
MKALRQNEGKASTSRRFDPRMEVYNAFRVPFSTPNAGTTDVKPVDACCACTACSACTACK